MKSSTPARPAAIPWEGLQERLTRAAQATQEAFQLPPVRARQILEERARMLARVTPLTPAAAETLALVIFGLGEERLALETAFVCEVLRPLELTPVPGTPAILAGLHNLRGQILPVFDLRRLFGMAPVGRSDLPWILVLGKERPEAGILADAVHEVATLRQDQIQELPGSVTGMARAHLRGVCADALLVLAGATLLQDPLLTLDQEKQGSP